MIRAILETQYKVIVTVFIIQLKVIVIKNYILKPSLTVVNKNFFHLKKKVFTVITDRLWLNLAKKSYRMILVEFRFKNPYFWFLSMKH